MPIPKISASEFVNAFGRWREEAQRGPVAVTSHGRVTGYFVSAHDFEAYHRARMRERQVIRTADLPPDILEEIANARMDSKYDFLDELMDETDAEPKP